MSRGLSRNQAEKMIVDGFFEPVMDRIPLESVRGRTARFDCAKTYGCELVAAMQVDGTICNQQLDYLILRQVAAYNRETEFLVHIR